MIGTKELQRYREMSVEEKLREFNHLMDAAFEFLSSLPPEERRRRWEIWAKCDEQSETEFAQRLAQTPR